MKYVPLAGLLFALWGLVTLDWPKLGVGLLMFLGGFAVDAYKKRAVLTDKEIFAAYRATNDLVRIVRKAFEGTPVYSPSAKSDLAQALFYLGMIDAASQSTGMSDEQFLGLFQAIFRDQGLDERLSARVLLFHQSSQVLHPAFRAVKQGGEMYRKFIGGNNAIPLAAGSMIAQFVVSPEFRESVDKL